MLFVRACVPSLRHFQLLNQFADFYETSHYRAMLGTPISHKQGGRANCDAVDTVASLLVVQKRCMVIDLEKMATFGL
jgi:hypothetical protein